MKVKEIMTENPIVAELPGTRSEVLKQLVRHNITGMPVIKSSDGTLSGFVTRQDIFSKPEEEQLALVMRRDYPTININASVKDAARIMVDHRISGMPVMRGDTLVGMITESDLFKIFLELLGARTWGLRVSAKVEEGRGVQGRRSRLGIEYPIGQGLFMQPTDLRILEDDIKNPLGQGFVHRFLLRSFKLAAL